MNGAGLVAILLQVRRELSTTPRNEPIKDQAGSFAAIAEAMASGMVPSQAPRAERLHFGSSTINGHLLAPSLRSQASGIERSFFALHSD